MSGERASTVFSFAAEYMTPRGQDPFDPVDNARREAEVQELFDTLMDEFYDLSPAQQEMYDAMVEDWQGTLGGLFEAVKLL